MDIKNLMLSIDKEVSNLAAEMQCAYSNESTQDLFNPNNLDTIYLFFDNLQMSEITNFTEVKSLFEYRISYLIPVDAEYVDAELRIHLTQRLHDLQLALVKVLLNKKLFPEILDVRFGQIERGAFYDEETNNFKGILHTLDFTVQTYMNIYG